jgi:hypothetical protein
MIRIDQTPLKAASSSTDQHGIQPMEVSTNNMTPKTKKEAAVGPRKIVVQMIMILVQIFCLVTCLILWKDGKVVGEKAVNAVTVVQNLQSENTKLLAELEELKKGFSQLQLQVNASLEIQEQRYITQDIKIDDFSKEISGHSGQISELNQKQFVLEKQVGFITLNNEPVTIDDVDLGLTIQGYAIKSANQNFKLVTRS